MHPPRLNPMPTHLVFGWSLEAWSKIADKSPVPPTCKYMYLEGKGYKGHEYQQLCNKLVDNYQGVIQGERNIPPLALIPPPKICIRVYYI